MHEMVKALSTFWYFLALSYWYQVSGKALILNAWFDVPQPTPEKIMRHCPYNVYFI